MHKTYITTLLDNSAYVIHNTDEDKYLFKSCMFGKWSEWKEMDVDQNDQLDRLINKDSAECFGAFKTLEEAKCYVELFDIVGG